MLCLLACLLAPLVDAAPRYAKLIAQLPGWPAEAQRGFASLALAELIERHEHEAARDRQGGWARGMRSYIARLRALADQLEMGASVRFVREAGGEVRLIVDRGQVMLAAPNLGGQATYEQAVASAWCLRQDCGALAAPQPRSNPEDPDDPASTGGAPVPGAAVPTGPGDVIDASAPPAPPTSDAAVERAAAASPTFPPASSGREPPQDNATPAAAANPLARPQVPDAELPIIQPALTEAPGEFSATPGAVVGTASALSTADPSAATPAKSIGVDLAPLLPARPLSPVAPPADSAGDPASASPMEGVSAAPITMARAPVRITTPEFPDAAAAAAAPGPTAGGNWSFSDRAPPSFSAGDGLQCVFEDTQYLKRKQAACAALMQELRQVADAMKAQAAAGVEVDWAQLALLPGGVDGKPQLRIARNGPLLRLSLPYLSAAPEVLAGAASWIRGRVLRSPVVYRITAPEALTFLETAGAIP